MIEKLRAAHWIGQIVGPHGSGKTTLTVAIANQLIGEFTSFHWIVLKPTFWPWRQLSARIQMQWTSPTVGEEPDRTTEAGPDDPGESSAATPDSNHRYGPLWGLFELPGSFLVVDGIELVSWWHRRKLIQTAARYGRPLLVTAHREMQSGLPVIAQTRPDLSRFLSIVSQLQHQSAFPIGTDEVQRSFCDSGGDIRAALSRLYDRYEARRTQAN